MLAESFNLLRSNIHNFIIIKNSHKNLHMYSTEKIKNNILATIYKNQNFSSRALSLEILLNKMKYFKMKKIIVTYYAMVQVKEVKVAEVKVKLVARGSVEVLIHHHQLLWILIQSQPKIIFYRCQVL